MQLYVLRRIMKSETKGSTTKEGDKMLKVTGLNELAEIIESNNRIEKAEKEILKDRIKELIAEGVDPEIAKVMAKVGL